MGPKRDEVTVEWKRLHNEEIYPSPNITWLFKSRKMRWAGHVAYMGAGEVYKGRRPLERRRYTYIYIRIILKWLFRKWNDEAGDWIDLGWRSLVNAVMNLRVSQNTGNFLTN